MLYKHLFINKRTNSMKKLFLTLAVALTALCASAKGNKIPVYAWAGFADNATFGYCYHIRHSAL